MATLTAFLIPLLLHTTSSFSMEPYSSLALDIMSTSVINDVINSYHNVTQHHGTAKLHNLSVTIDTRDFKINIKADSCKVHTAGMKLATQLVRNKFVEWEIRHGIVGVHQITSHVPIAFENMAIFFDPLNLQFSFYNESQTKFNNLTSKFNNRLRQLVESGVGDKSGKGKMFIGKNKFTLTTELYHFENEHFENAYSDCLVTIRKIEVDEMKIEKIIVSGFTPLFDEIINAITNEVKSSVRMSYAAKLIPYDIFKELVQQKHMTYCKYVPRKVIDKMLGRKDNPTTPTPTTTTEKPDVNWPLDMIVTDVVGDVLDYYNHHKGLFPNPNVPDLVNHYGTVPERMDVYGTKGNILNGDVQLAGKISHVEFSDVDEGYYTWHDMKVNIPISFDSLELHYGTFNIRDSFDLGNKTSEEIEKEKGNYKSNITSAAQVFVGDNKFILQTEITHIKKNRTGPCFISVNVVREKFEVKNIKISGIEDLTVKYMLETLANGFRNYILTESYIDEIIGSVFAQTARKMFHYCKYIPHITKPESQYGFEISLGRHGL